MDEKTRSQLQKAKQLIKQRKYKAAQELLKTVDHPVAEKWRRKLDEIIAEIELGDPFAGRQSTRKAKAKPAKVGISNKKHNYVLFSVIGGVAVVILLGILLPQMQQTSDLEAIPTAVSLNQSQSNQSTATAESEPFTPTITPTSTSTHTVTFTSTVTPSATITNTFTPTPTATVTNTATSSPTLTATQTQTPIPPPFRFAWNSNSEGLNPVIGPVSIPAGLYIATVNTSGFFIAEFEPISGECRTGTFASNILFNKFGSEMQDFGVDIGAGSSEQERFRSQDCRTLIAITNATQNWTLTIEEVR